MNAYICKGVGGAGRCVCPERTRSVVVSSEEPALQACTQRAKGAVSYARSASGKRLAAAYSLCLLQVALMFLTRGAMPHESLWKVWLGAANGVLPLTAAKDAACGDQQPSCSAAARAALLQACHQPYFPSLLSVGLVCGLCLTCTGFLVSAQRVHV